MKVCNAARLGYVHDAIVGDTQVTSMHYELLWMGFVHSDAVADPCTMPVLNGTAPVCTRCHSQSDPPTPQRSHFTLLYPWPLPSSPPIPIPTSPPTPCNLRDTQSRPNAPPPPSVLSQFLRFRWQHRVPPHPTWIPLPPAAQVSPHPQPWDGNVANSGDWGFFSPFLLVGREHPPHFPPHFPPFPPLLYPTPPKGWKCPLVASHPAELHSEGPSHAPPHPLPWVGFHVLYIQPLGFGVQILFLPPHKHIN